MGRRGQVRLEPLAILGRHPLHGHGPAAGAGRPEEEPIALRLGQPFGAQVHVHAEELLLCLVAELAVEERPVEEHREREHEPLGGPEAVPGRADEDADVFDGVHAVFPGDLPAREPATGGPVNRR